MDEQITVTLPAGTQMAPGDSFIIKATAMGDKILKFTSLERVRAKTKPASALEYLKFRNTVPITDLPQFPIHTRD